MDIAIAAILGLLYGAFCMALIVSGKPADERTKQDERSDE